MADRDDEQISIPPDGRVEGPQPEWRHDFPIDWPQDHYIARREYARFLGITSLAFVVGQVWIGIQSYLGRRRGAPPAARIAALGDVPVGEFVSFTYPGPEDGAILFRPSDRELVAFSQKCTHLACAVVPRLDEGVFHCPCHEGYFDLESRRALAGPPKRPLPRITLELRGEEIFATGVELRT